MDMNAAAWIGVLFAGFAGAFGVLYATGVLRRRR
jgi:hypothetical protein